MKEGERLELKWSLFWEEKERWRESVCVRSGARERKLKEGERGELKLSHFWDEERGGGGRYFDEITSAFKLDECGYKLRVDCGYYLWVDSVRTVAFLLKSVLLGSKLVGQIQGAGCPGGPYAFLLKYPFMCAQKCWSDFVYCIASFSVW